MIQWGGLGILRAIRGADVGFVQDVEPLGKGGHHAVFDPVVHHLDEVAGAVRAAVQPAQFGRHGIAFVDRRANDFARARCEVGEYRRHFHDRVCGSTDHQRIAPIEAEHATAGTDVDVVDALFLQRPGTFDVVVVPRVAAIDQRVAGRQQRRECRDGVADVGSGHHQPDVSRRGESVDHLLRSTRSTCALALDGLHRGRIEIVGNTVVAGALQPPNHVGAHAPETNHRDLHVRKVATFARRIR